MGRYGEQAVEGWHGYFNQNAARFSADTHLKSCAKLVRSVALAGAASDALMRFKAPCRKLSAGAYLAKGPNDKRRRKNKVELRHCRATTEEEEEERKNWAKSLAEEARRTVEVYQRRMNT